MAELGRRHHVAVTGVAKLKTIFQITALIMMIFKLDLWILPMYPLGSALLVLAAALTLWSMFIYLKAAWESLEDMEREAAGNGPGALDRSE
jgi:CDP-diacylglycerol--glycerol-3-phosphate 3-phosphatidyltransferase/cardiolipin synthase